jgi:hypothetical protein
MKGGAIMNKKTKKVIIIIGCVVVVLILTHLTMNNLVPFIKHMHSGGVY